MKIRILLQKRFRHNIKCKMLQAEWSDSCLNNGPTLCGFNLFLCKYLFSSEIEPNKSLFYRIWLFYLIGFSFDQKDLCLPQNLHRKSWQQAPTFGSILAYLETTAQKIIF